jgi:hypothetical protein
VFTRVRKDADELAMEAVVVDEIATNGGGREGEDVVETFVTRV